MVIFPARSEILQSEDFSDLTLVFDQHKFWVQRAIVCPHLTSFRPLVEANSEYQSLWSQANSPLQQANLRDKVIFGMVELCWTAAVALTSPWPSLFTISKECFGLLLCYSLSS